MVKRHRGLRIGRQAGFTMVEMLVVVAIIVGLAAAIIPNIGRFTGKGAEGATTSERQNMQAAMDSMLAEAGITTIAANNLATLGTARAAWAGFPTLPGGGAITLPGGGNTDLTAYLRANTTKYFYCWNGSGLVTEQFTSAAACTQ